MANGKMIGAVDPFTAASIVVKGLAQFAAAVANYVSLVKDARAWTISEQILGERLIDQVPGMAPALFDAGLLSYRNTTDSGNKVDRHFGSGMGTYGTIIPIAENVMTVLFGVRITNDEDLDALDGSPQEYYSRPDKSDIPPAAVDRAIYLKKNFYPLSTYNTVQWDLSHFADTPYVAPIPGIKFGTLYNGEIPGGGEIKDGVVIVPGALVPNSPTSVAQTNSSSGGGSAASSGGDNKKIIVIGALIVAALILFSDAD